MSQATSREEALFVDALARPETQRLSFVASGCGDDTTLRARVLALLAAHASPDSLTPPAVISAEFDTSMEKPGDHIGRYKIVEKVGEGGCGVVHLAQQEQPVRRRVALKVIKAGMDTREVIARFAGERQALALMDHPGIAKVFDAGATDAGRPYFAMEFVAGTPITRYCDEHRLTVRERLELFIAVCQAVQHAHQKGIIHRDLKPSNILVTRDGETPVPKVIDFGIAKAMQGRLTDDTLATAVDQFIGTPAYMSPEQAGRSEVDVDTRSDVYSLGVVLYELLVGRPPFDPRQLRKASREEIRRIIREAEPVPPAAHYARCAARERSELAAARRTEPAKLSAALAGDLDSIVLKALEKDRERRYDGAATLAADLTRYLQHEPVTARRAGKLYRLGKLLRRNRLAFGAAAAVTIALVAGTAVSIGYALRARHAEEIARRERNAAEELLTFMLDDLRVPLKRVGELPVIEAVADRAMKYFTGRPADDFDNPTLARHAKALMLIGELRLDQARYADAQQAFMAAWQRTAALVPRQAGDDQALLARGRAEWAIGHVRRRQGDPQSALDWFNRRHATVESLVTKFPNSLEAQRELTEAHHSLADLAIQRNDFGQAQKSFEAEFATLEVLARALPSDHELQLQQSDVVGQLGLIAERNGKLAEAATRYGDQVARLTAICRADPRGAHWRFKRAENLGAYASTLAITGERQRAAVLLAEARDALEQLVVHDPSSRRWLASLLVVKLRQAMLARALGESGAAAELVAAAREGFEALHAAEPTDRRLQSRLALAWRLAAEMELSSNPEQAAVLAKRAVELGRKLIAEGPKMTPERGELANACLVAGRIAAAQNDPAAAVRHWQEGYNVLASHLGESTDWRALDPGARLAASLGRGDEARRLIARLEQCGYVPLLSWSGI